MDDAAKQKILDTVIRPLQKLARQQAQEVVISKQLSPALKEKIQRATAGAPLYGFEQGRYGPLDIPENEHRRQAENPPPSEWSRWMSYSTVAVCRLAEDAEANALTAGRCRQVRDLENAALQCLQEVQRQ